LTGSTTTYLPRIVLLKDGRNTVQRSRAAAVDETDLAEYLSATKVVVTVSIAPTTDVVLEELPETGPWLDLARGSAGLDLFTQCVEAKI
jgi:hypothetical protein